jgi:hypothetical protein
MDMFQGIVEDIMKKYKDLLYITGSPNSRQLVLTNMREELKSVKDTWELLHPGSTTPDMTQLFYNQQK